MTVHTLKTWPEQFQAVCRGEKTFEWRKDDRGFEEGDTLVLAEWDPIEADYTGPTAVFTVGYVLRHPDFDTPDGWVILSLLPATPAPTEPWLDPATVGYDLDPSQLAAIAEVNALSLAARSWARWELARRSTRLPDDVRGDGPCADCGTPDNIGWFVDSSVWNAACPPDEGSPILCIPCFAVRAHKHGITGTWKLSTPRSETGGEQ